MNIIAADVGGTNTRFAFSDSAEPAGIQYEAHYHNSGFDSFEPLLNTFITDSGCAPGEIDALSLALPGIVEGTTARLTNLPWIIEKKALSKVFGIRNIHFMNDFQASACGTRLLSVNDCIVLNTGMHNIGATRVAVGAGTGLGVAWLEGSTASVCAHSTEAGHIDFAPVGDVQVELLQFLMQKFEHVSYERLLSGAGLVELYAFCSAKQQNEIDAGRVSQMAEQGDQEARAALSLFVQIYAAFVGNMALVFKPGDGIYITGGIAPKILKWMQSRDFIESYQNKGRMSALVSQIGVYLVTNERVGLLGALSEAVQTQKVSES